MIYKVILKNFKSNLKNYLLFFFGEVLSVAMIFSILAIKDILLSWTPEGVSDYYMLEDLVVVVSLVVLINVILMTVSIRYYVKTRLKDYGMFLIFGMRKRMMLCAILLEFGAGWLGSVIIGTGIGYGIAMIFKVVIAGFYSNAVYSAVISIQTYQYSFIISAVIMLLSVMVICVIVEEKGISRFIVSEEPKERRVGGKGRIIGTAMGIVLFAGAILWFGLPSYRLINSAGETTLAVCSAAVFLILTFGGSLVLDLLKRKKRSYYKNVLTLNQFFHRYSSNRMIVFLLFAIQMSSLGNMAVKITDSLPVTFKDEWYPYDYVWLGRQEDDKIARELVRKYQGAEKSVPVIRITTFWDKEDYGISQDSYEKLTGNVIHLSGKEALFVEQERLHKIIGTEIVVGTDKRYYPIHFGRRTGKLNIELNVDAMNHYTEDYAVTEVRRESIFGYTGNGWNEHVFVFSNDFFEKIWNDVRKDPEEPEWIMMMNVPEENQKEFVKELERYIDKNGLANEAVFPGENILNDMSLVKEQKQAENILQIIINMFLMILLYVGSIFIMGMKTFSELEIFRRKYDFLNSIGMQREELEKSIGREILNVLNLPLIVSYVSGAIFIIRLFVVRRMSAAEIATFMKCYGIIIIIYLLVQIFSAWCMKCYLTRKVMSGISH